MRNLKPIEMFLIKEAEDRIYSFYPGEQTKIRITRCSNPMFWYKDHIGEEFMAVENPDSSRVPGNTPHWKIVPDERLKYKGVFYVHKEDAEVIG
jgi:hypothetical protein